MTAIRAGFERDQRLTAEQSTPTTRARQALARTLAVGSPAGVTGFTTPDGRFTILMPHPERAFRTLQNSWHPDGWGEDGPWLRLFRNARKWVG